MVTSPKFILEKPIVSSLRLEDTMSTLFRRHLPLSESQIGRIACVTVGMLMAGTAQLSKVARWVRTDTQQDSRIQFVRRLLDADYLTQQQVYQPLLRQALSFYQAPVWHLVIDRTTLSKARNRELLAVSLNFRKRAIPLMWQVIDFGCTSPDEQIPLLKRAEQVIPAGQSVVLHGDTEFGSVKVMRFTQQQHWDFILGQPENTCFHDGCSWRLLEELPVSPRQAVYLSDVRWTRQHDYGPLNLFAFYSPHQASELAPRRDYRYCVTSLPITHTIRRVGRRRWGIEPFFRDCKSSGWELASSALTCFSRLNRLLTLLSIDYLWATCIGRWLCKSGRRSEVDIKPSRHLSLFRIGCDWLIHQHVMGREWPSMLALYS
jgi:hypothetical protein